MPQASEEDRKWARSKFGGIDDYPIIQHLESLGWKLLPGFLWQRPNEQHVPTKEENQCILFLVYEWDYGNWVEVGK